MNDTVPCGREYNPKRFKMIAGIRKILPTKLAH
jgi:hypothetical protein